ncbi:MULTISPECIES: plasmid partition family protein [Borreliella]
MNTDIFVRIPMGDKEVYGFVKQDTKRAYYILR